MTDLQELKTDRATVTAMVNDLRRMAEMMGRENDKAAIEMCRRPELLRKFADAIEQLQRELEEARKDAPTPEMIEAGAEVLYGHPKEKAIEWAKRDKFESCEWQAEEVFKAMTAARQQQG